MKLRESCHSCCHRVPTCVLIASVAIPYGGDAIAGKLNQTNSSSRIVVDLQVSYIKDRTEDTLGGFIAINDDFENEVYTFFCFKQRAAVITELPSEYVRENCKRLRS